MRCHYLSVSKHPVVDNNKRRVEALVQKLGGKMSPECREILTAAITEDLDSEPETTLETGARIVRLETQIRVLAEAMIALSDPKQNFALALRAVKIHF